MISKFFSNGSTSTSSVLRAAVAAAIALSLLAPASASALQAVDPSTGVTTGLGGTVLDSSGTATGLGGTVPGDFGGTTGVSPSPTGPSTPITPGIGGAAGGTAACSVKLLGTILGTVDTATNYIPGKSAIDPRDADIVYAPGAMPTVDLGARIGIAGVRSNTRTQTAIQAANTNTDFASCLVRAISRALIQQMTVSVVNWINSGFNGSPSFVTNYQQFFTQVGDNAVGNFLQGSDLAFLCSPIRLQIKVAVAQAYAKRNAAPQCSISKVVNNINSFINRFSQGGWQGLIAFTTVPTNNAYGAYLDAQSRLYNTVAANQGQKGLDLQLGRGFLSFTEQYDCQPQQGPTQNGQPLPPSCKTRISTPGSTIASQLDTTLGTPFRQLELAQSFDQIFSALINQLVVKTLQGGLSNLSKQSGFNNNPGDLAGSASAFARSLNDLVGYARQLITLLTQNVADLGAAEPNVRELASCWGSFATSTSLTTSQKQSAAAKANSAITVYNNLVQSAGNYTRSASSTEEVIAALQNYQSRALSALSLQELQTIIQDYYANSGSFPNASTVLEAEQARSQLSANLTDLASTTAAKLNECHAYPPTTSP